MEKESRLDSFLVHADVRPRLFIPPSVAHGATHTMRERPSYFRGLVMSCQSAPAAAPTAPPMAAPRTGLPPTTAPRAAPPAAPIAPPLNARCCWAVIFAHPRWRPT